MEIPPPLRKVEISAVSVVLVLIEHILPQMTPRRNASEISRRGFDSKPSFMIAFQTTERKFAAYSIGAQ
jgi:hypothetical protein